MKKFRAQAVHFFCSLCIAMAAILAPWSNSGLFAHESISSATKSNAQGFFFVFPFLDGRVLPPSVTTSTTYVPGRSALAGRVWKLRVLDAQDKALFSTSLNDPLSLMRSESARPDDMRLVARLPNISGASRLELLDPDGVVAWSQQFDAAFVEQARAQTANVASLAARARAPQASISGDRMARKQMDFAERRRDVDAARWVKTLGDPNASATARANATDKLHMAQMAPSAATAVSVGHGGPGQLMTANATATTLYLVSGLVSASGSGTAMVDVPVRVYSADGLTYVTAAVTNAAGQYNLEVPAGTYTIEADVGGREYMKADKALYIAPQRVTGVVVNASTSQDFNITLPLRTLVVNLRTSCPRCNLSMALTVAQSGNLLANTFVDSNVPLDGSVPNSDGTTTFTWKFSISPGVYDFSVNAAVGSSTVGVATGDFTSVDLTQTDQFLQIGSNQSPPWSGRLLDSQGNPLANKYFNSYDGLFHQRGFATTDANGNFSIPVAAGWVVEFPASETDGDGPLNYTVSDPVNLPSTIQTPAIALGTPVVNGNTTRVYTGANPDGQRLRLFFIGDGYTTAHETYTDTNGNGVWDGVLWYDLNKNGVWDPGEPYALYGDAVAPTAGTNPSAQNEPFTDLNGDGFPNFDDQSLFLLNVQQFTRQLLGADYWSSHKDAFQVDAAFVPSNQSGLSVNDTAGNPIYTANTAFNSTTTAPWWVLNINMTTALQVAEQLDPGFDCFVVMDNEPIPVARANETVGTPIGQQAEVGGMFGVDVNTPIIAHEMGHFVGLLADEYDFGAPAYGQSSSIADSAPNLTRYLSSNTLPWESFVAPTQPFPDLLPHTGIGVFETTLGWYRPTWNSIMRDSYHAHTFNAPSVAALDAGISRFTTSRSPDYGVLIELYDQTGGSQWVNKTGWLGPQGSECTWYGVTCDGWQRVSRLVLYNNRLSGVLPASFANLTHLQTVDLSVNQLTGPIPQLTAMTQLWSFQAHHNQLTGSIPPLTGLSNLGVFQVDSNLLSGAVPATPNPDALTPGFSALCPNLLTQTSDASWNAATGYTPWYAACNTLPSVPVTSQAGANGSISPMGTENVAYGSITSFTVTPNPGFFPVLDTTCGGALNGAQYMTGNLTYSCTVNANFVLDSIFANGFE